MLSKNVHIGTSGYNYKHWRNDIFYPKELKQIEELEYYSKHFLTVEINAAFYRSFSKSIFQKWCRETPDNFIFCLKGPRYVTHLKKLNQINDSVLRFYESALGLGTKFKISLWQFPKNFKFNNDNLDKLYLFLKLQPKEIKQAIEFRDVSWFNESVYDLLRREKSSLVINSSRSIPYIDKITTDFTYIRFHGPKTLYSSSYSEVELKEWAHKINKYNVKECYCYFNNDSQGYAVRNALTLMNILRKRN